MTKPDESRLDQQGRDVTHLPGLWSEDDRNSIASRCSSSDCDVCNGKCGQWDEESQDQWHWCDNCDAADKHYEQTKAMRKKQESRASAFAGFFLGWDNSEPPQLWVWRGEPGDETAEAWQKVEF